jgi:SAM-dependent methyltransferase
MEWFERWFGEEYKTLYPHRDEAQAQAQVEAVTRAAGALPEWKILDVGCGAGRHLRAFRKLGAQGESGRNAFGADLSAVLLRDARAGGLRVVRADMRRLPFRDHSFHLVTCFFTSFGYFATADEDAAALAGFRRLVRASGFLFLDLPNAAHVAAHLVPDEEVELAGRRVEIKRRLNADTVVKSIRILSSMDSASADSGECAFEERVRLYPPDRIDTLARGMGLEMVALFGDEQGAAFDPQFSPRMSLLFRCP